jgi:predicted TIM-barrel fold metal-dependent hydrolase
MLDRRRFLNAALAAPLAVASEPALPIIDTHQHLWDLKKFRLAWLKKGSALDRSFLPADYEKAAKGLGIVGTVYLEVDVDPAQQQAEADYIVALCKKGKTLTRAAVISGRPASEGFAKDIRPFKGSAYVRGLRQVLHGPTTPAGYCLDRKFVRGIRLLGELGLHFELCIRHAEMPDAIKLVDECKDTRFVLDHCGNPDLVKHEKWKKDLAELAKRKNVVVKVSGIVASARPGKWKAADLAPVVNHTLDTFGPERVMFGGDWPVCLAAATLAEWVGALKQIVASRKAEQQRKLFHDNAVRFYRLRGA